MSSIRICAPATDRWRSLLHIILLGYTFVVSAPAFAHMSGASIAAEASSVSASNPSNPATANLTGAETTNDKAKPAERRGRKATGLRFLREAKGDTPKDPRSPGCRSP